MIVVTVARKPLSAGSVAANVLAHGVGALNIDATRIATADDLNGGAYSAGASERHDGAENWRYKRGEQGGLAGVEFQQPPGRWPANLLLGHMAECRPVGTRNVKVVGATAHRSGHGQGGVATSFGEGGEHAGFRNADGTETVEAWECVLGCPVATLDEQTGVLSRQGSQKRRDTGDKSFLGTGHGGAADSTFYGDEGGPSRFFKQVKP